MDERGVPLESDGKAHGPDCSCPECQRVENEVIVDRLGRPVDFEKECKGEGWRERLTRFVLKLNRPL
ncbi:MAG: hypothetical protein ABSG38_02170 [Spirochaetia bacterium]